MTTSTVDGPLIGSLFSGTGMLDLAVQAVFGGTVAWQSEVDPAACTVLAARFPGTVNVGDITCVDWSTVLPVSILCGGFPCQGVSSAGARRGLADPRSGLWSAFVRAIQELRPAVVVIENVRGLLSTPAGETPPEEDDGPVDPVVAALGGWPMADPTEETTDGPTDSDVEPGDHPLGDGADGPVRAFGVVVGDLADLGYDTTWVCLPASHVGAPHRRTRVVILATLADPDGGERDGREHEVRDPGSDTQHAAAAGRDPEPAADPEGVAGPDVADSGDPHALPVRADAGTGDRAGAGDPAPGDELVGRGAPVVAEGSRGAVADTERDGRAGRPAGSPDPSGPTAGRTTGRGCGTCRCSQRRPRPGTGRTSHPPPGRRSGRAWGRWCRRCRCSRPRRPGTGTGAPGGHRSRCRRTGGRRAGGTWKTGSAGSSRRRPRRTGRVGGSNCGRRQRRAGHHGHRYRRSWTGCCRHRPPETAGSGEPRGWTT